MMRMAEWLRRTEWLFAKTDAIHIFVVGIDDYDNYDGDDDNNDNADDYADASNADDDDDNDVTIESKSPDLEMTFC